jgi:vitamin B12 transporter
MRHHIIKSALLAASYLTTQNIFAKENILDPVIVTATRTAQTEDKTLAPISLITRKDIESSQANTLPELLSGLPGIHITVQGGAGKESSMFMRGTSTRHILFLIDGVKIGSASLGQTAFQHIPLSQIERIEIIRGPRSSLYGSDAIGGVVQIFTRQASKETQANISAGYGTHATFETSAGISGSTGKAKFGLQASSSETDGINSLSTSNPDTDGYINRSISARFDDAVNELLEIGFNILYTESDNEYDNAFDATSIDSEKAVEAIVSGDIKLYLTDNWDSKTQISTNRDESNIYQNNSLSSSIDTNRNQITWQNDIQISDSNMLSLGYDFMDEEIETSENFSVKTRNNKAVFAQLQSDFKKQNIILSFRQDNNDSFGHHTTGNLDWRFQFNKKYSITASYGQAFKAPTFNDLFWPAGAFAAGNPDLEPETSKSTEIITHGNSGDYDWFVNIYKTRIKDLIDWSPDALGIWMPTNIDDADIKGIETSIKTSIKDWDISFNMNFLEPRNKTTDKKLERRASKHAQLTVDKSFGKLKTGISFDAQGDRFDDSANLNRLSGYGLVNIKTEYLLQKNITIKAKIDNLLDKEYQTAKDYTSLDRVVFASMTYSFK